jgi:hypothetical protein
MTQTRDGIRLSNIINVARGLDGVTVRPGRRHESVLNYAGLRPCPVAESTNARRMLVPWFRQATGYNTNRIYQALRSGSWEG